MTRMFQFCCHDWRDTGMWLDSWTVRRQCAKCGLVFDPPPNTDLIESAMAQRRKYKLLHDSHKIELENHPEACRNLMRSIV